MKISKQLAAMLQTTMDIRENSFDNAWAAADTAKDEMYNSADYYGKTLREAAEEAATQHGEPEMADILYYLAYSYWNDVQVWAENLPKDGV